MEHLAFLIPDFTSIWVTHASVTTRLSAAFVLFLIIVLTIASGLVLLRWIGTFWQVRKAMALLSAIDSSTIAEKRRDITNDMTAIKGMNRVWREWNETLVESQECERLLATSDALQFFNSRNIAPDLVDNRFLSAVPGMLTAVGVFGTFLGLTFGLSGLDLSGGGMERITSDVNRMISGASLAFVTSVWGVGTSIVFNFFEKYVERDVRKRIRSLRGEIEVMFPRINPEDTLLLIEQHGRQSRETLQGLAEQIGERMQQSVTEMGAQMQQTVATLSRTMLENVGEILNPAIETLVTKAEEFAGRQESGAKDALADLIGQFTDVLGARAEEQGIAMEEANKKMGDQLVAFATKIEQMSESLEVRYRNATIEDEARSQEFKELVQTMQEQQSQLSKTIQAGVKANNEATSTVQSQASELILAAEKSQSAMRQTTAELEQAVGGFGSATSNIKDLVTTLREATDQMAAALRDAGQATNEASTASTRVSNNLQESLQIVRETQKQIETTRLGIKEASNGVVQGMNTSIELNKKMGEQLKNYVEQIQKQATELLNDYSEQVNAQTRERLEEWNKQTRSFCNSMYNVVTQMNSVIGEMEDRRRR